MEYKSISFQMKDLSKDSRTAVIAHAAYNNIDRTRDISRKGMFNRSWKERKDDIAFYKNHDPEQVPGKPTDFWEDDQFAYTKVYLGTHALGEDTLKMMDEGIIKKASFGYHAEKKDMIRVGDQQVRELKEVIHIETSVLTVMQANPLAGVRSVTKAIDLQNAIIELKESIDVMEGFCRNTAATDDCIKSVLKELKQAKAIIQRYTQDGEPLETDADVKGFAEALYLLTIKTF